MINHCFCGDNALNSTLWAAAAAAVVVVVVVAGVAVAKYLRQAEVLTWRGVEFVRQHILTLDLSLLAVRQQEQKKRVPRKQRQEWFQMVLLMQW